jgi:signal transduction histidine kinase
VSARSLRLRLLLAAAVAVLLAMTTAWFAMTWLFQRHLERRVADDLTRLALQLVAELSVTPGGALMLAKPPADARFETPASGLYWQLTAGTERLRARALWDEALPLPVLSESARWTTRSAAGPFGQRVFLLERTVRPARQGPPVLVQVAQDAQTLRAARAEFGGELRLFLGLLWLVLSAAAAVQVQLGLRPLRRVREELQALQRNPTARLSAAHPREIQPLTGAINDLASAREKDLLHARRRAADLAHSLKTPLAALAAQSRRARSAGAVDAADGLERAIAAVAAAVDAELARARVAGVRRGPGCVAAALTAVERVVGVIEHTELGAQRVFDVDVAPTVQLPLAPADLIELLGALLENAARYARRQVRVRAWRAPGATLLSVEDDGAGLDISAEQALLRGGRLDEAGPGHQGLGLAIVRELADATGAEMTLDRASLGGLRVCLRWPAEAPGAP